MNNFNELISVCKETNTKFELEEGLLFNFVRIGKIIFTFSKEGKYYYCHKVGQKVEI